MSDSCRVLMAVPFYPYPVEGGLERQAHELSKALLESGIDVQALSFRFAAQSAAETVEGILVTRVSWLKVKPLRFVVTPFSLIAAMIGRRDTFDVVHLHQLSWFSAFILLIAKALRKATLIKLSTIGSRSLPGLMKSRFGGLQLKIFSRADVTVAMTPDSYRELLAVDYPRDRILTTPNGIRVSHGDGSGTRVGELTSKCRVVFVGRISKEKRIDDLLNAWKYVVEAATVPASLELWGSGPDFDAMQALSSELGIDDSVSFRGHVDSVREKLSGMDVFVLTSEREGNSNAILEAMAAGLPIVSTRVGGTPMQVGVAGAPWLVEPGDRQGLAERLAKLIADEPTRQELGGQMFQRVLDHFDIREIAKTYASAYELILAGNRERVSRVGDPVVLE